MINPTGETTSLYITQYIASMVKRITLVFDDDEFEKMRDIKKGASLTWEGCLKEGIKSLDKDKEE